MTVLVTLNSENYRKRFR